MEKTLLFIIIIIIIIIIVVVVVVVVVVVIFGIVLYDIGYIVFRFSRAVAHYLSCLSFAPRVHYGALIFVYPFCNYYAPLPRQPAAENSS